LVGDYLAGVTIYYAEHQLVRTTCQRYIRLISGTAGDVGNGALTNGALTAELGNGALTAELGNGALTSGNPTDPTIAQQQELAVIQEQTDVFKDVNLQFMLEQQSKWSPDFKPEDLVCKFVEITNVGLAEIGFSQDIKIVPNLNMINNATIYLD
jgi:hypothetical protein